MVKFSLQVNFMTYTSLGVPGAIVSGYSIDKLFDKAITMVKELQTSYKIYFNTLKTIDFIKFLDNVTIEWE